MKIGAILEARIESERLPGKMLFPMYGQPAISQVINRVYNASKLDQVIVACPDTPANEVIDWLLRDNDISVFHGPMDDVLKRTLLAAKKFEIDLIVSITCDCPLIDPRHIDFLIDEYMNYYDPFTYLSNIHPRSWPDGLDIQIYPTTLLEAADKVVSELHVEPHRHHSGWNIYNYREQIGNLLRKKINIVNCPATEEYCWPELGLTLDEFEDYKLICTILGKFDPYGANRFRVEDVIDWLRENPEMICNKDVKRKVPGEG